MKSKPIFILLTSIIVAFLTVQLSPTPAISGGKWRSVPADETRIVLKGWPEQNQFKYRKGWHSDNWAMECEQSYNTQGLHKTTIQLCRIFPGFYYQAAAGKKDISEYPYWNWTTWNGSKIKNGQDTALKFEDPRVFRHLYFTQYENECQFMTHAREAGSERYTAAREGQPDFRPIVTVMTCNTDEKFQESSFKIDDANGKMIISYPGKPKEYNSSRSSVTKIDTTKNSGTYKPTTNFTSSDTKTSVTSNADKRSVPFAAHWEAKSGVLLGVLNYPKAGDAGSLSASSGDISCQGTWQRAGQGAENGTWSIACSDGRTASGFYKMHEVGKGTGTGTDPDGNKVEVTWGG